MPYGFDEDQKTQMLRAILAAGSGNLMGAPAVNVGVPTPTQAPDESPGLLSRIGSSLSNIFGSGEAQVQPPGMAPVTDRASWLANNQAKLADLEGNRMDMSTMIPALALMNIGTAMQTRRDLRPAITAQLPGSILAAVKAQGDAAKERALLNLQAKYYGAKDKPEYGSEYFTNVNTGETKLFQKGEAISPDWIRTKEPAPKEPKYVMTPGPDGQPVYKEVGPGVPGYVKPEKKLQGPTPQLFMDPNDHTKYAWVRPGEPIPPGLEPKAQVNVFAKETEKQEDKKVLAKMLTDYEISPKQLSKRGDYNTIIAQAKRDDPSFKPADLELKWNAADKWVKSLNSSQQANLEVAGQRVIGTVGEVKRLATEMNLSGFHPVNYAEIESKMKLAGNTKEGQIATQYVNAVNDLKELMARAGNGGYAPTESVWKLVNKQVNENYGVNQMHSSLDELEKLMTININAGKEMRSESAVWQGKGTGGPAATQQVGPGVQINPALKKMSTQELIQLRDKLKGGQ